MNKKSSLIAILLVILLAAVVGIAVMKSGGGTQADMQASVSTSSPATTTTSSVATSTAPTTTEVPVNSGPAPAGVGTFTLTGATNVAATYDSMPYVLPLNPAGPQDTMVRWVDGWGQSPATAELGTTYVLGHAWGQQKLVFNPISETVTATADMATPVVVQGDEGTTVRRYVSTALNGSTIAMSDAAGSREWVVDTAYLVDKYDAAYDTGLINESIPGRIVLIACSVDGNVDLNYNVIVEGHLV